MDFLNEFLDWWGMGQRTVDWISWMQITIGIQELQQTAWNKT